MGKILPGESTGLATMVNPAGCYGIRTHPISYEKDHVLRFFHVPAVRERFFQFFVGELVPMSTVCVKNDAHSPSLFSYHLYIHAITSSSSLSEKFSTWVKKKWISLTNFVLNKNIYIYFCKINFLFKSFTRHAIWLCECPPKYALRLEVMKVHELCKSRNLLHRDDYTLFDAKVF